MNESRKKDFQILAPIILLLSLLFGFLWWYEGARSRDAETMSAVNIAHAALARHFSNHSGYPGATQPIRLGAMSAQCLSPKGFEGSCEESYGEFTPLEGLLYQGRNVDGGVCTSGNNCQSYAIEFSLKTGALGIPQGNHIMTPLGVR